MVIRVIPATKYRKTEIIKNYDKIFDFFRSHLGIMNFLQILALVYVS